MVAVADRHASHVGEWDLAEVGSFTFYCCGSEGCGVVFGVPTAFVKTRRADHDWWHCPNGHRWQFTHENEEERLRRQLAAERDRAASLRANLDQEEARTRALKGVVTKTKKKLAGVELRVANGVCPCCGRTFKQLAQHMANKHPEYVEQAGTS